MSLSTDDPQGAWSMAMAALHRLHARLSMTAGALRRGLARPAATGSVLPDTERAALSASVGAAIQQLEALQGGLEQLPAALAATVPPAECLAVQRYANEQAAALSRLVAATRRAGGARDGSTILVADASVVTRLALGAELDSLGIELLETADGQAALQLARAMHPRVVILDLAMPKLSGVEVCAQLKADPATADIRVAIMTASGDDDVQGDARAAGVDCFIAKPWRVPVLREQIAALLSG